MKYSAREDIIQLTPKWTGERFEDGRPKVSDDILRRMRNITMEEAWGGLWRNGYKNMFVTGFQRTNKKLNLVGRAVTATFIPSRPDLQETLLDYGHNEEKRKGFFNQWVIDGLVEDDVIVVDLFDKIFQGTFIGGNLATAIASRTKRGGLVCWGGIRDMEQIEEIENLQVYHRGEDPTAIADCVMSSFNGMTRIGGATCLPGDVVVCTMSGVIFVPAHLAEDVVVRAEKAQVRDIFGFQRLEEGKYDGIQVDAVWTVEIFDDFLEWFKVDEKAAPYRHLDFSVDYEHTKEWNETHPTGFGSSGGVALYEQAENNPM